MTEHIDKYLLENGERITDFSELNEGETYALGWGKEGYRGFVMPSDEKITKNKGNWTLNSVRLYQIPERGGAVMKAVIGRSGFAAGLVG